MIARPPRACQASKNVSNTSCSSCPRSCGRQAGLVIPLLVERQDARREVLERAVEIPLDVADRHTPSARAGRRCRDRCPRRPGDREARNASHAAVPGGSVRLRPPRPAAPRARIGRRRLRDSARSSPRPLAAISSQERRSRHDRVVLQREAGNRDAPRRQQQQIAEPGPRGLQALGLRRPSELRSGGSVDRRCCDARVRASPARSGPRGTGRRRRRTRPPRASSSSSPRRAGVGRKRLAVDPSPDDAGEPLERQGAIVVPFVCAPRATTSASTIARSRASMPRRSAVRIIRCPLVGSDEANQRPDLRRGRRRVENGTERAGGGDGGGDSGRRPRLAARSAALRCRFIRTGASAARRSQPPRYFRSRSRTSSAPTLSRLATSPASSGAKRQCGDESRSMVVARVASASRNASTTSSAAANGSAASGSVSSA